MVAVLIYIVRVRCASFHLTESSLSAKTVTNLYISAVGVTQPLFQAYGGLLMVMKSLALVLSSTDIALISADYAAKLEELEKSLSSRPVMASGYDSSDMPDVSTNKRLWKLVINLKLAIAQFTLIFISSFLIGGLHFCAYSRNSPISCRSQKR